MSNQPMTYAGSGVDYNAMDPFKITAQMAARETSGNISRLNGGEFRVDEESRGESVFLIEAAKSFFAHVEEGLGTKNLAADAMRRALLAAEMREFTGKSYYDHIAQDTVAMIVNDMITLGALPLSMAMHLAVGESSWFDDEVRSGDLIRGWKTACDLSGAVWGGGETPTLKGIVLPGAAVLSGSASGIIKPKERRISARNIQSGDAIIVLPSSGVHANGLTLAREIADKLPKGYLTELDDGRTYGDALLDPTRIYVPEIEAVLDAGVHIHYAVNVTGHGWRKLMRAVEPFVYVIEWVPEPQAVFRCIAENGPVDDCEMYSNYNMGAGFALYVDQRDVDRVLTLCPDAFVAGYIEKRGDEKKVVIKPVGLEYDSTTLGVR